MAKTPMQRVNQFLTTLACQKWRNSPTPNPEKSCQSNETHKTSIKQASENQKGIEWARRYMKTDFRNVLLTDERRVNLHGPDSWSSGWILHGRQPGVRIRRQQGGGAVMFWAGIMQRRYHYSTFQSRSRGQN